MLHFRYRLEPHFPFWPAFVEAIRVSVGLPIASSVAYVRKKYVTASGHHDKQSARLTLDVERYSKSGGF